jgi:acyl-CoA synthetase (NDP forming)
MGTPNPVPLLSDDRCLDHPTLDGHPEAPERITAVRTRLRGGALGAALFEEQLYPAEWATVLTAHEEGYLRQPPARGADHHAAAQDGPAAGRRGQGQEHPRGFRVPQGALVTTAEEAAEHIGYPVAMKIVSPDIVHKSDIGGVRLGITSREGVQDAFELMVLRLRQRAPEARLEGIYVEKMLHRGLEVSWA